MSTLRERVEGLIAKMRNDLWPRQAMPLVNHYTAQLAATLVAEGQGDMELAEERSAHDQIATLCFAAGAESPDGTSVGAVKDLSALMRWPSSKESFCSGQPAYPNILEGRGIKRRAGQSRKGARMSEPKTATEIMMREYQKQAMERVARQATNLLIGSDLIRPDKAQEAFDLILSMLQPQEPK